MKKIILLTVFVISISILLVACGQGDNDGTITPGSTSPSTGMPVPGVNATEMIVETEEPTSTPEPTADSSIGMPIPGVQVTEMVVGSNLSEAFRDDGAGFELNYPAGWMVESMTEVGSRGSQASLASWQHTPGDLVNDRPEGSTLVTMTVYQWEPKNDLSAYLTQRKGAWEASGMQILEEETVELPGGQVGQLFLIETVEKTLTHFLLTTLGENYLQLAGDGDLAMAQQIMLSLHSLR